MILKDYLIDQNFENLPELDASSHFSNAIYYRLKLPELLPDDVDTVLYLDSDTICVGDIDRIFDVNIKNYVVAGVLDPAASIFQRGQKLDLYINSGVLLINVLRWRQEGLFKKCLEWVKQNPQSVCKDQDALNHVLRGRIRLIDGNYNKFVTIDTKLNVENDKILHYISKDKPWCEWYPDNLSEYYIDYIEKSPWSLNIKKAENLDQYIKLARKYKNADSGKALELYDMVVGQLVGIINAQRGYIQRILNKEQ